MYFSRANTVPDIGALKAAATPIWIDGPSLPKKSPPKPDNPPPIITQVLRFLII